VDGARFDITEADICDLDDQMFWAVTPKLLFSLMANCCPMHSGDLFNFYLGTDHCLHHFVKSHSVSLTATISDSLETRKTSKYKLHYFNYGHQQKWTNGMKCTEVDARNPVIKHTEVTFTLLFYGKLLLTCFSEVVIIVTYRYHVLHI